MFYTVGKESKTPILVSPKLNCRFYLNDAYSEYSSRYARGIGSSDQVVKQRDITFKDFHKFFLKRHIPLDDKSIPFIEECIKELIK